jgi:hypothetical protein
LIYGIKEDKGVPVEVCGLEISENDIDKIKLQIEGMVRSRSNIDPRISIVSVQPNKIAYRQICNHSSHSKKLGITTYGKSRTQGS